MKGRKGFFNLIKLAIVVALLSSSCFGAVSKEGYVVPLGYFDKLDYNNGILQGAGWAADKIDGVAWGKIIYYVDGIPEGNISFSISRPDVATFFNNPVFTHSGWSIEKSIKLSKGLHNVTIIITNKAKYVLVLSKEIDVQ